MAFIIVADSSSQEIDRRELAGPVIIGRSPECDLPVRDILLSRRHCILERIGDAWVIADLNSKNGTRVNGEPITRHILHDTDVIRLGRTRIAFCDGPFVPAPPDVKHPKQRPADPLEALAGTLSGFRFDEAEEETLDRQVMATFPRPHPHPAEPRAYQAEQVSALISDIASSAWDTMLAEPEKRPRNVPLPRPNPEKMSPPVETVSPQEIESSSIQRGVSDRFAVLYVTLSVVVTGLSVWVISLGW